MGLHHIIPWSFRLALGVASLLLVQSSAIAQEICDNGIDDDGDGLIDLNDTEECPCVPILIEPENLIVNGSFEEFTTCPFFPTQIDYTTGWNSPNWNTPEYLNTCGYTTQGAPDAGLLPFPDGEGAVGIIIGSTWKEYIRSCLASPLVTGATYRFQFNVASFPTVDSQTSIDFDLGNNGVIYYGPLELVLYGNTTCNTSVVPTDGCLTNVSPNWVPLGSILYTPEMAWSELTFDLLAPSAISSIALGPPCNLSGDYGSGPGAEPCYPYFLFDDLELSLVDMTVVPEISLVASGDPCQGDLLLEAFVTPDDPLGQTLQWYLDGIALVGEDSPTYSVDPGLAGMGVYQAVVFSDGTCALSTGETVSAVPIQVTASSATICAGDETTVTASGAETYIWSDGTVGNTLTVLPSSTTTYSVIGTGTGCSDTASTIVQVDPLPMISLDTDVTLYEEMDSVQIVALVDTGAYVWSPTLGLSCTDCLAPYASPTLTTEYCITSTLAACAAVACITVIVPPPLDPWDELGADLLYVPNSFTPNNDGINDTWGPITGNWETIRVDVFDRWGRSIHGTDDGGQFWDGQLRDGTAAPTGIYTYMIRVRFTNRTIKEVRGHVVLLR